MKRITKSKKPKRIYYVQVFDADAPKRKNAKTNWKFLAFSNGHDDIHKAFESLESIID